MLLAEPLQVGTGRWPKHHAWGELVGYRKKDETVVAGRALEHMVPPDELLEQARSDCHAQEAATMVGRWPAAGLWQQWAAAWLLDQSALMLPMAARQARETC